MKDPGQDTKESMLNGLHLRILFLLISVALPVGCNTSSIEPSVKVLQNARVESLDDVSAQDLAAQETTPNASPSTEAITESSAEIAQPSAALAVAQLKIQTVRKIVSEELPPSIPQVLLAKSHAKLCTVNVGESFPLASLPRLGGDTEDLGKFLGKPANVVLLWTADPWMSRTALIDLENDIVRNADLKGVGVVGIAVGQSSQQSRQSVQDLKLSFPQLLDTQGEFFSKVGSVALPRIFVLDAEGKVVWFDIEYSEGTRRELLQTLAVLTKTK